MLRDKVEVVVIIDTRANCIAKKERQNAERKGWNWALKTRHQKHGNFVTFLCMQRVPEWITVFFFSKLFFTNSFTLVIKWSLCGEPAVGEPSASGMTKCSAGVNSDLTSDSFGWKSARRFDVGVGLHARVARLNWPLTSRDVFFFLEMHTNCNVKRPQGWSVCQAKSMHCRVGVRSLGSELRSRVRRVCAWEAWGAPPWFTWLLSHCRQDPSRVSRIHHWNTLKSVFLCTNTYIALIGRCAHLLDWRWR